MSAGGHQDPSMGRREALVARARALASRRAEVGRAEDARGEERDTTPALGKGGGPASWRRAAADSRVALSLPGWADGRWSYLFGADTSYATAEEPPRGMIPEANRRGRGGPTPSQIHGPIMKAPVWTWEVPLYFWFGGMAAGGSFVALACDLAGDERSARIARRVAVGALLPSPPLLIMDLGRPERFYNMLRIFKPRSPMSTGAWCLSLFGALATGAAGADLLGRKRTAKVVGGANAVVGGYLGSYTGVLLAATAVPVWSRSKLFLGPIFVSTGALTGAATTRLVLAAGGMPADHPTAEALGRVETGAMAAELLLSAVNEHYLGRLGSVLEQGHPGRLFRAAKWLARAGLTLRLARPRPWTQHAASVCFLTSALCFRYAWVGAGPLSADDDEAVARNHRGEAVASEPDPQHPIVVTRHD
jgi:formate-dependent nitrite reductase membrane component NrfD